MSGWERVRVREERREKNLIILKTLLAPFPFPLSLACSSPSASPLPALALPLPKKEVNK